MDKLEIIKKDGSPKFRIIVHASEDYSVGVLCTRQELKNIFFIIKSLLEEKIELNEPSLVKPKKEIVLQEVEKVIEIEKPYEIGKIITFLLKQDTNEIQNIIDILNKTNDDIIIIDDEEKRSKSKILSYSLVFLLGFFLSYFLIHFDIINKIGI